MSEPVERDTASWVARQRGDTISIQGVVRYPDDFSTSHLALHRPLTDETGIPHFVLGFGRDKEPFCWPDLVGQVHYEGKGFPRPVAHVVVLDGETRVSIPVRTA